MRSPRSSVMTALIPERLPVKHNSTRISPRQVWIVSSQTRQVLRLSPRVREAEQFCEGSIATPQVQGEELGRAGVSCLLNSGDAVRGTSAHRWLYPPAA